MAQACSFSYTGSKGYRNTSSWTSTYYCHANITGTYTTSNGVPGYNLTLKRYTSFSASSSTSGVTFSCNWGGSTVTSVSSSGTYHSVTTNLGFYAEGSTYTISALSCNLTVNSTAGTASTLSAKTITVPTNTYSIEYHYNDTVDTETINYGDTYTITHTEPTLDGYDFVGWTTTEGSSSANYHTEDSFIVSGNVVLYAVWRTHVDYDARKINYVSHDNLTEFDYDLRSYIDSNVYTTELYKNTSGTSSAITLSDSIANYDTIEIYFGKENRYSSQTVPVNLTKYSYIPVNLMIVFNTADVTTSGTVTQQWSTSTIKLTGTSLTWVTNCAYFNVNSNLSSSSKKASTFSKGSSTIKIYAVYGIKYF